MLDFCELGNKTEKTIKTIVKQQHLQNNKTFASIQKQQELKTNTCTQQIRNNTPKNFHIMQHKKTAKLVQHTQLKHQHLIAHTTAQTLISHTM